MITSVAHSNSPPSLVYTKFSTVASGTRCIPFTRCIRFIFAAYGNSFKIKFTSLDFESEVS